MTGAEIIQARKARGWTQRELARRAKIHQPNLCAIERGLRTPRPPTLACIALALGLTGSDLLPPAPLPADLDERLTWLESEVAALQDENARLLEENNRLENANDAAQARITELEADLRELTAGVTAKQETEDRDARIVELYMDGQMAMGEIAAELQVGQHIVSKALKAAGIETRKHTFGKRRAA